MGFVVEYSERNGYEGFGGCNCVMVTRLNRYEKMEIGEYERCGYHW